MDEGQMENLVCSIEAVSGAVRLRHVQDAHLASAGLQQCRAPVVVMGQHLQEMLRMLQQAIVHME